MRIATSTTGPSLDAEVDPRFGRCRYFIIVDPDTMEFETLENANQMASGGAGIASAQLVANNDVQAVLTGNCGPNAFKTLEAAEIEIITGVFGKVRDAIEGYKSGRYHAASGPTVDAHHGMGGGPEIEGSTVMGRGLGMGMGMGKGMGRSTGLGMGKGPGVFDQELEALKAQTLTMGQQLSDVIRRLDRIENIEKS